MDTNPGLCGSVTGEFVISCRVHFRRNESSFTIAIPAGLPNWATYSPPPFPVVGFIKAAPPRYDQFADTPRRGFEVQPPESLPVVLSKKMALTLSPCVLTT